MRGVRLADADGRAERLTGVLRVITDQQARGAAADLSGDARRTHRPSQPHIAARRTGARPSKRRKAEDRNCAYLVASIDRLAMINDAYGFGAADEVIVAVGERLARTLRGSDIIGRIAGNKLGVILGNCSEREIALVAERLRAAVRDDVIDTRAGTVSATISRRRGVAAVGRRLQPGSDAARRGGARPRAQRAAATASPSMPNRRSAKPRACA